MIWYLLYPFRGTTEPPVLSANHPIRRLFFLHGSFVARHPVHWILVSVAIAVVFCYPVVFLYSSNSTTGLPSLPHHVWTSARPLDETKNITPDITIRQAWVHGSFMRAIEPEVLIEALRIQEALLGQISNYQYSQSVDNPATTPRNWATTSLAAGPVSFFHSPLFYWNCSVSAIGGDHDLLETINAHSHRVSPANLTLRHSTVFAGKKFSKDRLIAVDALVLTLFHRVDPKIEDLWNSRAEELAKDASGKSSVYPADGKVRRSRLYEFWFEPMSLQEDIVLGFAYALMALYVAVNLRKLRAFKSRIGLVAMAVAQIGISIFSSFTICALFRIDLSQIPRELYPFVVLAFGIENMFQLINAVLVIPPEVSTVSRISNALGNIGHLALARAAQNLLILWLLSKIVWVTAPCIFSSIALVLDFFFHLTFFLAVLSVDVQRMDLQDSLDRANLAQGSSKAAGVGKQRWRDALLHGKLPLSTRVAGTAVMVCFVTALNWHFFDNESPAQSLSRLVNTFRSNQSIGAFEPLATPASTVNQARNPTSWLRLQDHDTAKEVIRLVKPRAHSFVAQVYDPLVFVIKGADRGQPENSKDSFLYIQLSTIPNAARDHILPLALLIVLIVAVVTILMNYLLWSEVSVDVAGITDRTERRLLIKNYSGGHALDVVMLSASSSGGLASLGLDRRIIVRSLKMGWTINVTEKFQSIETGRPFWPIVALALGDFSNWLAICSRSGLISLLDLRHQSAAQSIDVDLDDQEPSAFFFTSEHDTRLVIVKPDGWIIEIDPRTFEVSKQKCFHSKIVTSTVVLTPKLPPKVLTATKYGYICSMIRGANGWEKEKLGITEQFLEGDKSFLPLSSIVTLPALGLLLVVGQCQVKLINPQSGVVIYQFKTSQIKAGSLRAIHSRRRQCLECITGSGVSSFSILYTEKETHSFNMHTYTLDDKQKNVICLRATEDPAESGCQRFGNATMTAHWTQSAGVWEVTAANSAVGVRRKVTYPPGREYHIPNTPRLRRREARECEAPKSTGDDYEWEAWTMSAYGELTTSTISTKTAEGELFISQVGPICKVGTSSVAVGFGNSIKLLVTGNERFNSWESDLEDLPVAALGHRRRLQARKSQ